MEKPLGWVGELRKDVPVSMSYVHPNLAKESRNQEMLASDATSWRTLSLHPHQE